MATKSGAVLALPDTKQLQQLPKFHEAIEKISDLEGELIRIESTFLGMTITDRGMFNVADTLNKRTKEIVREAEAICQPYKDPLRKWLDLVQSQFNRIKNHREQLRSVIEPKLDIFSREEAAQAQAEQDKIQKQLNKQYRNSDEPVPEVRVASGVRGGRTYYHAEVVDKKAFFKYIVKQFKAGDEGILDFIEFNQTKLREAAEGFKDSRRMEKEFPGVHAFEKKSF